MTDLFSPEQMEWFRQQALDFAKRAVPAEAVTEEKPPEAKKEDSIPTQEEYQKFLQTHPARGTLKVQVSTARGAIPVEKANVEVSKQFLNSIQVLYRGVTDNSGIVDQIQLPAIPALYSQSPETAANSGTNYRVAIRHPSFEEQSDVQATIFDQIQTILPVMLRPRIQ